MYRSRHRRALDVSAIAAHPATIWRIVLAIGSICRPGRMFSICNAMASSRSILASMLGPWNQSGLARAFCTTELVHRLLSGGHNCPTNANEWRNKTLDMQTNKLLQLLADGQTLACDQAKDLVSTIMRGNCRDVEIASVLTALRVRGETLDELVGAALAMRDHALRPTCNVTGVLDTCGTGGDRAHTFNVSTATAIVTSACGVPVAKHGNRAVSSSSGSADVFAALGVAIDAEPRVMSEALGKIGLAFFFAPIWHPAMRNVMPVRAALGFRTIFNFLGPLTNPAAAAFQLVGASRPDWANTIAAALARLGTQAATVVVGSDGLDEVTLAGSTRAVCIRDGASSIENWTARSFDLPEYSPTAWRVASAQESAQVIESVLAGHASPARDLVLANAATALWTAGMVATLTDGVALAAGAIDSGAARRQLDALAAITAGATPGLPEATK